MKANNMIIAALVSTGLAFGITAQAKEREEEQTISASNVPQAVQQAARAEAKGGTIVRGKKKATITRLLSRGTESTPALKSTLTAKW